MSAITFHTLERDVDLRGTERSHAGVVVDGLLDGLLGSELTYGDYGLWCDLLRAPEHVRQATDRARSFTLWLRHHRPPLPIPDPLTGFCLALNTAIDIGSPAVQLLARVHGTCELHGYVEGPDRLWMADIIADGLRSKVMRANVATEYRKGWEDVEALLRERDDGPVVMSYSVCDSFPDPWVIGAISWEDEGDELDTWEALTADEQWGRAITWLRDREATGYGVQLGPEFANRGFESGWSALDLIEWVQERRVENQGDLSEERQGL